MSAESFQCGQKLVDAQAFVANINLVPNLRIDRNHVVLPPGLDGISTESRIGRLNHGARSLQPFSCGEHLRTRAVYVDRQPLGAEGSCQSRRIMRRLF